MFILTSILVSIPNSIEIPVDFNFRININKGWIGPETKYQGGSGYMRIIKTPSDLNELVSKQRLYQEVLMIPYSMMKNEYYDIIATKYKPLNFLQGVVGYPDENENNSTSSAPKYPNQKYSYNTKDYEWNPYGDGSDFKRLPFLIFKTTNEYAQFLLAAKQAAGDRAGIYINNRQHSRGNFKQAIGTIKKSQPLADVIGGVSVLGSTDNTLNNSAVWAIASIDSFGSIPYGHIGADHSFSGFVGLLGAIDALKNASLNWTTAQKQLRFAFFDAEEIGYAGSRRFLAEINHQFDGKCLEVDKDMGPGTCANPVRIFTDFNYISPSDFDSIVELKSIGLFKDANKIYAHTARTEAATSFVDSLISIASPLTITKPDSATPGVPPSSTNSFLRMNNNIKHVVLTGFDEKYVNQNIGSPGDIIYNTTYMTNAATTTARILAKLCFDNPDLNSIVANETFIESIMKGFTEDPSNSSVFNYLFPSTEYNLPKNPSSIYAGVYNGFRIYLKQRLIARVLDEFSPANLTDIQCNETKDCVDKLGGKSGFYCAPVGMCLKSKVQYHPAYPLGVEQDKDQEKYMITNTTLADDNFLAAETRWSDAQFNFVYLPYKWTGRIAIFVGVLLWLALGLGGAKLWMMNLTSLKK